jgi:hypothetical protein
MDCLLSMKPVLPLPTNRRSLNRCQHLCGLSRDQFREPLTWNWPRLLDSAPRNSIET